MTHTSLDRETELAQPHRLVCITGDDLDSDRLRQALELLKSPTDKLISPVSRALRDQRAGKPTRK